MVESNPFSEKIFNFDDRLIRFAGECIFFTRKLDKSYEIAIKKEFVQAIEKSSNSVEKYNNCEINTND